MLRGIGSRMAARSARLAGRRFNAPAAPKPSSSAAAKPTVEAGVVEKKGLGDVAKAADGGLPSGVNGPSHAAIGAAEALPEETGIFTYENILIGVTCSVIATFFAFAFARNVNKKKEEKLSAYLKERIPLCGSERKTGRKGELLSARDVVKMRDLALAKGMSFDETRLDLLQFLDIYGEALPNPTTPHFLYLLDRMAWRLGTNAEEQDAIDAEVVPKYEHRTEIVGSSWGILEDALEELYIDISHFMEGTARDPTTKWVKSAMVEDNSPALSMWRVTNFDSNKSGSYASDVKVTAGTDEDTAGLTQIASGGSSQDQSDQSFRAAMRSGASSVPNMLSGYKSQEDKDAEDAADAEDKFLAMLNEQQLQELQAAQDARDALSRDFSLFKNVALISGQRVNFKLSTELPEERQPTLRDWLVVMQMFSTAENDLDRQMSLFALFDVDKSGAWDRKAEFDPVMDSCRRLGWLNNWKHADAENRFPPRVEVRPTSEIVKLAMDKTPPKNALKEAKEAGEPVDPKTTVPYNLFMALDFKFD